ncbi:MAG: S8 family serine peptidase [Actinomycetota bacterium]
MASEQITDAIVVPRCAGGKSIYDVERIDATNIREFLPDRRRRTDAARMFRALGFSVHHYGGPAIVLRGPQALFNQRFQKPTDGVHGVRTEDVGQLADHVDRVSLVSRYHLHQSPASTPPQLPYHHVAVPDGVAAAVRADDVAGATGAGVCVAVCDSGFFPHPWFTARGARVTTKSLPGSGSGDSDEIGHGTAVTASLLSVAPRCDVVSIKMQFGQGEEASSDAVLSLQAAAAAGADVINCSWGRSVSGPGEMTSELRALEYVVAALVHSGRVIVATSGNYPRSDPAADGEFGYPGQHPDVISVGGTYVGPDGHLAAADYASGFVSEVYPGRSTPDVTGLCGLLPAGVLIASPVPPGSMIDRMAAVAPYPNGDDTGPDDGWACLSGTSLAAPQVSGVIALVLELVPELRSAQRLRSLLRLTARDVADGTSNPRAVQPEGSNRAAPGTDVATGAGFVDASAAVAAALTLRNRSGADG